MPEQSPEVPRNLLALKSMVIAMAGLLILCALILVGVGVSRMKSIGFDPVSLKLAAGCSLGEITAAGDRLVIEVEGRDDCRRVIIADMESGKVTGEFAFPPE